MVKDAKADRRRSGKLWKLDKPSQAPSLYEPEAMVDAVETPLQGISSLIEECIRTRQLKVDNLTKKTTKENGPIG